jgi:hypothetical protein
MVIVSVRDQAMRIFIFATENTNNCKVGLPNTQLDTLLLSVLVEPMN